jgi:hypothetical protein
MGGRSAKFDARLPLGGAALHSAPHEVFGSGFAMKKQFFVDFLVETAGSQSG